jgi:hypothetical protein
MMRSRIVSDSSVKGSTLREQKLEGHRPATKHHYYEQAVARSLAAATAGKGKREPSHEGPLGCQVELLEEFMEGFECACAGDKRNHDR